MSPGRSPLALAVVAVAQLMVVLDVPIVNVALPSIQRSPGFSAASLEWVVNAYALAFGGLLLLGGRVADALLAGTFAEGAERHRAMGVYAAMSGAGGALGNVLGGVFTDELSWRWVLFANVPIGLFVLFAAPLAFSPGSLVRGRLDLPGALAATLGMTSLVYGLIHAAGRPWDSAGTVLPLIAGAVLLGPQLLFGVGVGLCFVPLTTLAVDGVGAGEAGATPAPVTGAALTHGYATAFLACGFVLVAAFVVTVALLRRPGGHRGGVPGTS